MFEAADIIIYIKGKGIVLKEKSLVAYNTISSKIMAFGEAALTMAENPADNIKVISPLRRGMVADYIAAVKLFTYLLSKTWEKKPLCKVPVAVCVPKGITEVEKKALEDSLYQSGAREVFITDVKIRQLLKETPGIILPKNWQKFKVIISITNEEPKRYISEQFLEVLNYAESEGISSEEAREMFQDISSKFIPHNC
ncbi:MAG: hypothetical protein HFH66_13635 [Lachnospiraceae bacterium]|nr:hypothetical protein [Lachnospiraceae bacterium]